MTKKKKFILAFTLPISAFFITIICLSLAYGIPFLIDRYKHRDWTKLDYCQNQWEIQLPKNNVAIEYNFSNRGGFHGDGVEYTVCRYSACPSDFLEDFQSDIEGKYTEKFNRILPMLQNSKNKHGEFFDISRLLTPDENILWHMKIMNGNNTLLLAYNAQSNILYIIEDFI